MCNVASTGGVLPQLMTVSFPAVSTGPLQMTVSYSVPPDDIVEEDETFTVDVVIQEPDLALFNIGDPTGVGQARDSTNLTIINDDG